MDSNIFPERPDWLTDWQIKVFRQSLKDCPNPYTDEEIEAMENDDPAFSIMRANARTALDILTEYGIPLTDDDDTTE